MEEPKYKNWKEIDYNQLLKILVAIEVQDMILKIVFKAIDNKDKKV